MGSRVGLIIAVNHFEALRRDFDYDRWANLRWLECLLGKGFPEPDTSILSHLLAAEQIWLTRVCGKSPTSMPVVDLSAAEIDRLHAGWLDALAGLTDDHSITYRRTTGQELTTTLAVIARHVVNHGAYHRGELRGLCRSRADDDFPETDFSGFALAK